MRCFNENYELIDKYIKSGYSEDDAIPKVVQDIVLLKIGNSKYSRNITIKGGVVMHNISKDMRRATRDMDIDFIKYSLEDINRRLSRILNNNSFQSRINTANNNWLELPITDVIRNVLEFFNNLVVITN